MKPEMIECHQLTLMCPSSSVNPPLPNHCATRFTMSYKVYSELQNDV